MQLDFSRHGLPRQSQPVRATASVGTAEIPETVRIVLGIPGRHLDPLTLLVALFMLCNF
jgi:hypothetical protein